MHFSVKRRQPSISETATSRREVPTPVLTASVLALLLQSAGEGLGGGNEFSELESSIPDSSSTEATAEIQGLRLPEFVRFSVSTVLLHWK